MSADEGGFTLVEFLAALAIFAFGVLAFFSLSIQSVRMCGKSETAAEASLLVGEEMERLRRDGWEALAADCRAGELFEGGAEGLHRTIVKGKRRYRLLVERERLDQISNLVRITCYWEGDGGRFDSSRRLWLTSVERGAL